MKRALVLAALTFAFWSYAVPYALLWMAWALFQV